jgi:hypothetical protein
LPAWLHLEFVIPLYLAGQTISKLTNGIPVSIEVDTP